MRERGAHGPKGFGDRPATVTHRGKFRPATTAGGRNFDARDCRHNPEARALLHLVDRPERGVQVVQTQGKGYACRQSTEQPEQKILQCLTGHRTGARRALLDGNRLVGESACDINFLQSRDDRVIERPVRLEVSSQAVVFDRFARGLEQPLFLFGALGPQALQLRLGLSATRLKLADDLHGERRHVAAEESESVLRAGVGRVALAISAGHFIQFALERFDLRVQRGDTRVVGHAGQPQEQRAVAPGTGNGSQIGVELAHEGLKFLNLLHGDVDAALRLPDHSLERGGPLPFAKTLHRLLGQAHLVAQPLRFLDEELRCRLGRLGGLLHEHAQVFVGVAVGQLGGKVRIGRAGNNIDQAGHFPVGRFDHE